MAQESPRSTRWVLVAFGVLGSLLLGIWGFALKSPSDSLIESFYRAIQLFVLEIGDTSPPLPWQLEVARLAAPAMTVTSAVVAAVSLSRDRVDAWRAQRERRHVVVCGLDERGPAPAEPALALRRAGHHVVAVAADDAGTVTRRLRNARIPVVVGDPADPLTLKRAGVATASHLVVLTPDLELAGRIALSAVDLPVHRENEPLTIHLEISTPELATLLRAVRMTSHAPASWRLEELDLAGVGARILVDAQPAWPEHAAAAHVLVVGDTPLAQAVTHEVTRRWRHTGQPLDRLTITRLGSRQRPAATPATAAYVCLDDETQALASALTLVQSDRDLPVLLRLETAEALGALVHRDSPTLRVVSLGRSVLTPEVLLDSTTERIARALHDSYRRSSRAGDRSAASWDELPESLRASNRAQADNVATKLAVVGRVLVPDDGSAPDTFSEEEINLLGELEHERWTAERRAAGWTPGPRDAHARTTPYLVPWDDLEESVRELDRQFVRSLPDILADAGLILRRVSPASTRPTRTTHAVEGG